MRLMSETVVAWWEWEGSSASVSTESSKPAARAREDPRWNVAASGYSIRISAQTQPFPCRLCGRLLGTGGPTGFLGDYPVCDACLLAGDRRLGMVMTLMTVCRFYGSSIPADTEDERRHRQELLAFARVYEKFAAQFGPARPWSDFLSEEGP